mmetsp:Transcript_34823/g.86620  ORF Transcript_34823/g.86620 Transcript_34823/m.86620 type:complete len:177 (+) Transcript_34823:215-745(+)
MIVAALEAAFTTLGPEYLSRCWAQRTSWLGFEFDSTLGYPGEGPPAENFITEEMERWLDELEEEKWLLEQLPVVQKIDFLYGEAANANKVQATLLCCWAGERFKRIKEQCTDDGKKPTFLEAIRALRETITREHCCTSHSHHPRAVARRDVLAREGAQCTVEAASTAGQFYLHCTL